MTPRPAVSHHRHRGGRPRRRHADGAVRRRLPHRQEGHDRSRHRGRRRRRADVPRAHRASAFRIIRCSREEMGGARRARRARAGCSIRSTARRTSRTACRSSARRWRSRSTASRRSRAVYDPDAQGAVHRRARRRRVSERPAAARVVGRRAGRRDARHRLSVRRPLARRRDRRACSAPSSGRRAPCGGSGRRRSISATSRPAGSTGSGRRDLKPWDIAGGALIVAEAAAGSRTWRASRSRHAADTCWPPTDTLHDRDARRDRGFSPGRAPKRTV